VLVLACSVRRFGHRDVVCALLISASTYHYSAACMRLVFAGRVGAIRRVATRQIPFESVCLKSCVALSSSLFGPKRDVI
jgi:hypothetical protein